METTNKYYTPSIEELHVNMECELETNSYDGIFTYEEKWEKVNYKLDMTHYRVRIKYLDFVDIESLGFEYVWSEKTERIFKKDNIILTWWIDTVFVQIDYGSNNKLFKGVIKNKSELKFILKALNIL